MGSAQRIVLTGTFDIECAEWDHFSVGVTYRPMQGPQVWTDADAMIRYLEATGGTWWAWGGGRYDTLLVADRLHARRKRMQASLAGSSITRMVAPCSCPREVRPGRKKPVKVCDCEPLTIRDARALIPLKLERAAELAGLAAPRALGWPCGCGEVERSRKPEGCGGYCAITRTLTAAQLRDLTDYCTHDARVAYAALAAVVTRWHGEGFELRGTVGGTAWHTAQAWADLPDAIADERGPRWRPQGDRYWTTCAKAYYGGRLVVARPRVMCPNHPDPVEGLCPSCPTITHWDMGSAYPAALARTALPQGRPVELDSKRGAKAYEAGCDGVYLARVDVPTMYLPPLPVRTEDDGTVYPVGRIQGWWVLPELQAAQRRGCSVGILEALVFPDEPRVMFADVVKRWYDARMAAGKDTAWGELYRLVLNSVTGKLGQSPEHESVVFNPRSWKYCEPGSPHSIKGRCTSKECTGRCHSYRSMRDDQSIAAVPFYRIDTSSHVHWAAYLTAATRIAWLDAADLVGADLVYGATDSIWTMGREPTPQGDALGAWASKGEPWHEWTCPRPGAYAVRRFDGSYAIAASGMPDLTWQEWGDLTTEDPRERRHLGLAGKVQGTMNVARGVMSLAEAAAGGGALFRRSVRTLRMSGSDGWYGDRKLARADGRTYPTTYGESYQNRRRRREA